MALCRDSRYRGEVLTRITGLRLVVGEQLTPRSPVTFRTEILVAFRWERLSLRKPAPVLTLYTKQVRLQEPIGLVTGVYFLFIIIILLLLFLLVLGYVLYEL